jgi:hypothetical protein
MVSSKTVVGIIIILSVIELGYSQCNLGGFSFSSITGSFSSPWVPPGNTQAQIISYAPCSSGLATGCGSSGPPLNQCERMPNCCAVCQTWNEETTGSQGACLGLSTNLLTVESTGANSVRISYGRGDLVQTTPRQIDINIQCDPTAAVLSFVNFVEATPSQPPPPSYKYTLSLTSSVLCGGGGVSGGTIFVIILFTGAILYVIGGVVYNKFQLQKDGIELLPNVEFWREVPGYIQDGAMFTKSKIMSIVSPQQAL